MNYFLFDESSICRSWMREDPGSESLAPNAKTTQVEDTGPLHFGLLLIDSNSSPTGGLEMLPAIKSFLDFLVLILIINIHESVEFLAQSSGVDDAAVVDGQGISSIAKFVIKNTKKLSKRIPIIVAHTIIAPRSIVTSLVPSVPLRRSRMFLHSSPNYWDKLMEKASRIVANSIANSFNTGIRLMDAALESSNVNGSSSNEDLGRQTPSKIEKKEIRFQQISSIYGPFKARSRSGHKTCERLSETEKYAKLERIGGRNQQFMANSPDEAGRNFAALLPKEFGSSNFGHFEDSHMFSDDSENDERNVDVELCDDLCVEIKQKLSTNLLEQPDFSEVPKFFTLEDTPIEKLDEMYDEGKRRSKNRFVPIGNCTSHGQEESRGQEKLCTACQGVYILSANCFPAFLNSVICDKSESAECIFDRFSGAAQGQCRAKSLSFKVMRNKGTKECERWVFEYLSVPVACECFLNKNSIWLEAIPPE